MKKTYLILTACLSLNMIGCGDDTGASGYNCNNLPTSSSVQLTEDGCSGTLESGKITYYVVTEAAGQASAIKICNAPTTGRTVVPADQAAFDAGNLFLNNSAAANNGFTFTSNHDYVKGASCASGSITGKYAGSQSVQSEIWVTQP